MYAPMSNVGKILYDKDAMYINLPSLHFTDEKSDLVQQYAVGGKQVAVPDSSEPGRRLDRLNAIVYGVVTEGVQMVRDLQKLQDDIEDKLHNAELSLFKHSYGL